ncbi:hypothetical protein [Deinococcus sp. QL22]|uniref:hypothetical protein n=1 Tax=Deinococcus sp. QL22 TaxID=2939437 RepID=UPI002016A804|nr:hypothetical protein [Deinococcus sp. QL22]UQN08921.1 hypothetical protein M1R55_20225 [Deinococcus sp. QL22]
MTQKRNDLDTLKPLGKSVEEIERDSQNRVNPPALEGTTQDAVPAVPPINSTGTWSSQTGLGASTPEVPLGPIRPLRDDE